MTKVLMAATGSGKTAFAAAAPHVTFNLPTMTPGDCHLDHDTWRPHQLQTLEWLTGGLGGATIALCRTLNLQTHQYAGDYGFDYLTGRRNWLCIHPMNPGAQSDECLYGAHMHTCEYASRCPYLRQKAIVKASSQVSLNYAYFLVAGWPRQTLELDPSMYLFLDECHELSKLIIEFAGTTITNRDRRDYKLPHFPRLKGGSVNKLMAGTGKDVVQPAKHWLLICLPILAQASTVANRQLADERDAGGVTPKTRKLVKRTDNLLGKVKATIDAIESAPDDWYIRSGPNSRKFRGRPEPAFIARPLSAKHHYKRYFEHGQRTVLMSATIGGVDEFATELGLTLDEYEFMSVPNQFTPQQRPIHILDTPSMGAQKPAESDRQYHRRFDAQADAITKAIKSCPGDWSGLLLVTSKRAAIDLTARMARRGLQRRIWLQPGSGDAHSPTHEQTQAWHNRRRQVPNSIAVSWTMHTGYDGLDEKFVIVCKAPFPRFGSPGSYEESWRKHSHQRYLWQTACQLAQGLGRTRRGRPQDYDTPTERRGFVAIADKSWTQCQKYLPQDILDAIQT